jgi:hypothetical protein
MKRTLGAAILASILSTACSTVQLPPPQAPARSLPESGDTRLQEQEPEEGFGRVVITTDVPARVDFTTKRVDRKEKTDVGPPHGNLCADTPCWSVLPYGEHELTFKGIHDVDRIGKVTVRVRGPNTVVNHTLGQNRRPVGQTIGLVSVGVGIAMIIVAANAYEDDFGNPTSLGRGLAIGGLGAVAVGGAFRFANPTKLQEGSSTVWNPPRIAGAQYGIRF